ncbi:MAG: AAA family ATPase [Polyangiaceae bacterium]
MYVAQLSIENFRGILAGKFEFHDHTLVVGQNNVGKSTLFEALELALGPDRQARFPAVEEYDFYNARYLDDAGEPVPIRISVTLVEVTKSVERACFSHLERWDATKKAPLGTGDVDATDTDGTVWCLRLLTIARYNKDEDEFEVATYYERSYDPDDENASRVPRAIRRSFGFLYLRALRTGSRALSLERGSLLDVILRVQSLQTGIWEDVRSRLESLTPPIGDGATKLAPVLKAIEERLAEYIPIASPGQATKLFVSQLTREHLRKTLSFFLSITPDQKPVPFQEVGTGTLNTLVLALLSFIAELKDENVIFAMEEPEIALPPHTQRRIAAYLLSKTTQCFVTSHSPYIVEQFEPSRVLIVRRDDAGVVTGTRISLDATMKAKVYRRQLRRGLAEALLGRGAIVTEGFTEQVGLRSVADRLEQLDSDRYPLDLAGVSIVSADGDGSLAEFGKFFCALGMPVFGLLDNKVRTEKDQQALEGAGFTKLTETQYRGMEDLLAAEVPLPHQWTFLSEIRDAGVAPTAKIPAVRPGDDAQLRTLTSSVLKDSKGWGRAAELLDLCSKDELPPTLVDFLELVYAQFPKPLPPSRTAQAPDAADAEQPTVEQSPAESTDV